MNEQDAMSAAYPRARGGDPLNQIYAMNNPDLSPRTRG